MDRRRRTAYHVGRFADAVCSIHISAAFTVSNATLTLTGAGAFCMSQVCLRTPRSIDHNPAFMCNVFIPFAWVAAAGNRLSARFEEKRVVLRVSGHVSHS